MMLYQTDVGVDKKEKIGIIGRPNSFCQVREWEKHASVLGRNRKPCNCAGEMNDDRTG
jgi:hypothetical protein